MFSIWSKKLDFGQNLLHGTYYLDILKMSKMFQNVHLFFSAFTVIEFNPRDCNPAEETVGNFDWTF